MERQEWEALLTLAEELHFGRTADRLGVSVGRVSQIIRKLERRVGVQLFERTSRRVVPTMVGQQLCDDLLPVRRQMDAALARAVAAGRGVTGELRVGYSSPMAANLILRSLEPFKAAYPDCELLIQEIQLSSPFSSLRSGGVHVQITELPLQEADLVAGPTLITCERALMVPSEHPFARCASVSLEDLALVTLLTIGGSVPQYWSDHHFPRHTPSGRPIHHGHQATSWQEIPLLVGAGQGVSLANRDAEPYHRLPGVVWVPVRERMPCDYAPIWLKQAQSGRVRAFLEVVGAVAGTKTGTAQP
ncbi:LysR family transcriptional regulator [Streptomyces sp. Q6]|uniref:LysR family transcriptional regulator n=1 Tax=Streptomyces citrinus TaxID=3118173 RepID=A0ACD5AIU7_9ACTN